LQLHRLSAERLRNPRPERHIPDPIVVNPGQTVSLVCITTGGEPPPLLTWVTANDSLPQRSQVKGGTLTLPAISSEEAGVYSCVASNNVGNPAKKSTTIVVRCEYTPD
uniref:Ig-like domain-containing protein n=1 Tax=Periophthalmus magnuspinnatus TaxID=409849 RepID=A0A3B4A6U8_9GOBI